MTENNDIKYKYDEFGGNQKCCYTREDKSEQAFYFCPCLEENEDLNQKNLICDACKIECHKEHQDKMTQIIGFFECSCGKSNHEILNEKKRIEAQEKYDERIKSTDRKCFYSYFDTIKENQTKQLRMYKYKVNENEMNMIKEPLLCEICFSRVCSKNKSKEQVDEIMKMREENYVKVESSDPDSDSDKCSCKQHNAPSFISIQDEFSKNINFQTHFLNFNVNFLLRNPEFMKNIMKPFFEKIDEYSKDINHEEDISVKNNKIKSFYQDFHLLNTITFLRKMVDVYSNRNDTTLDFFSKEYAMLMKSSGIEVNIDSEFNCTSLVRIISHRIENEIKFDDYSTYFLIKFSFLYLLHNINTIGFIKSTMNTLNSNELLNLSFFQRYVYIQRSMEFFYLSKRYYTKDQGKEKEAIIKKYEEIPKFLNEFILNINLEMESFLSFMNYSNKANIIFTEDTYQVVITSYTNTFHFLIKYNLIADDKELQKFYSLCFDILVLSINFYSSKDKERKEILNIVDDNRETWKIEEINRIEDSIIKFKQSQKYVFVLVRSIFFYLVNKNDEVFLNDLSSELNKNPIYRKESDYKKLTSDIEIENNIKKREEKRDKKIINNKYVHEKSSTNNLSARVFCICLYQYMMCTYKEKNEKMHKALDKIMAFDFYAKNIFEFLCDDSQNYLRTLDLLNLDYNNSIMSFLDDADKLKLDFKSEKFAKNSEKLFKDYEENRKQSSDFEIEIIFAKNYVNEVIDILEMNNQKENNINTSINLRSEFIDIVSEFETINNKFFDFEINYFDNDYFQKIKLSFKKMIEFLDEHKDKSINKTKLIHALMLFSYSYQIFNEFLQITCTGLKKVNETNIVFHDLLDDLITVLQIMIKGCYSNTVMILSLDSKYFTEFVEKAFENYLFFERDQLSSLDFNYDLVNKYFDCRLQMFFTLSIYSKSICMSCLNNFISFIETIEYHLKYLMHHHRDILERKKIITNVNAEAMNIYNNRSYKEYNSHLKLEFINANTNKKLNYNKDSKIIFNESVKLDEYTCVVLNNLFKLYKELINNCSNENIEIYDGFESFQLRLSYFKEFLNYDSVMKVLLSNSTIKTDIKFRNTFIEMFTNYMKLMSTAYECDFYLFGLIKKQGFLFDIDNFNYINRFKNICITELKKQFPTNDKNNDIKKSIFDFNETKDEKLLMNENRDVSIHEINTSNNSSNDILIIQSLPLDLINNLSKFYFLVNKGKFRFNETDALLNKFNNTICNKNAFNSLLFKNEFHCSKINKELKKTSQSEVLLDDIDYISAKGEMVNSDLKSEDDFMKNSKITKESFNRFPFKLEEDDDPYDLKQKLQLEYEKTKNVIYLKLKDSETEQLFLYYKNMTYLEQNAELSILINEFTIKVVEKNILFNLWYFLIKLCEKDNITGDEYNNLFKFYQNCIVRELYFLTNYYIINKKRLRGKTLETIHVNLILFLKATLRFYQIKDDKLFNFDDDDYNFYAYQLKEKQVIKYILNENLLEYINEEYQKVCNRKVSFYELEVELKIFKNVFAIIYDKVASNQDLIDTYKSRYFTFEKVYYKQFDNDHRTTNVQNMNFEMIASRLSKSHLQGKKKFFYTCMNKYQKIISQTFNDNLSLIRCFEFNDLTNKEFLPENCFFYLLNKIFDNYSYTAVKSSKMHISDYIQRNLNEGFANVNNKQLKIHNSFAIRIIRNLTFNDITRFQKLFIKHFDKSQNGAKIFEVLVKNIIFPFSIHEFNKILDMSYYDKKNSTTYDLCVSALNFFQHLCESTCINNQNLLFALLIKPNLKSLEFKNKVKTYPYEFVEYSFINFLFKIMTTCFKTINFEDAENHRYQNSFFKNISAQQRLFSRFSEFILEILNGFKEGKTSRYFYYNYSEDNQNADEDFNDWEIEHRSLTRNYLNSKDENGRFDLLGDFSNKTIKKTTEVVSNYINDAPDEDEGMAQEEAKDYYEEEDLDNGLYRRKSSSLNRKQSEINKMRLDIFKGMVNRGIKDSKEKVSTFNKFVEFHFITFLKYVKDVMLKFGYHNAKNNIIFYNFLRILNYLLYDTAIYKKTSSIISSSLIGKLSYNYLKFVFIRNLSGNEYDIKYFHKYNSLVPIIKEKILYSIYFLDNGRTFDDIYFKISTELYIMLLLYETRYNNIDAKVMLALNDSVLETSSGDIDNKEFDGIQDEKKNDLERIFDAINIKSNFFASMEFITQSKEKLTQEFNDKTIRISAESEYYEKNLEKDPHLTKFPNFQHASKLLQTETQTELLNKLTIRENKALNEFYLNKVIGSVEFNINDRIFPMVYVKNPELTYFNDDHLKKFYDHYSDHSDPSAKINSLIDYSNLIITEVYYYNKNIKPHFKRNFLWNHFNFDSIDIISLILTTVIMIIELSKYNSTNLTTDQIEDYHYTIVAIAIFQLILNCISLFIYFALKYPLRKIIARDSYKEEMNTLLKHYYVYLRDSIIYNSEISFTVMNVIIAAVGIGSRKLTFLFAFQLFTFNKLYLILNRIIQAFMLRFLQLINMVFLLIIFIYFYSTMGFYHLTDQFDSGANETKCPNLIACFIRHFDFGQRSDGGISDDLEVIPYSSRSLFYERFFYDMIFFVIVKLLLLNMINGIIVSTFSDMRESDDEKYEDRTYQCFICSIEKKEFDKQNIDFKEHINGTHSVTQYVNYIIMLKLSSEYDLTYNELEILESFKNRKVDIFPIHQTLDLPNYSHEDEDEDDD